MLSSELATSGVDVDGRFSYGGQAIIEGVMMRGRNHTAIAVRKPDGDIITKADALGSLASTSIRKVPFLRGVVVLAEAMVTGIKALQFSAAVQIGREDQKMTFGETLFVVGIALAITIGVFFVAPVAAVGPLTEWLGSATLANAVEGVLRLALFLGYLGLISRMKDIQRVFQYHGAEHMTIHAFEHNAPLTVEGVRAFPTAHPRCGTSFLITVMVLATVVFAFIGHEPLWWRFLSRIVLVPVIAGVAYEVIRLAAFNEDTWFGQLMAWPGLFLQKITTKQPDDSQIEVALASFKAVRAADATDVVDDVPVRRAELVAELD